MGKTYRRFDRDDEYHDIRWEKERDSQMRNQRHRREIEEPVIEPQISSNKRNKTMFKFYK